MTIGKKIQAIRKTRGLNQQQLADLMDVTRSTISNWECSRRHPHINELELLANKLSVTLEYFNDSGDHVSELIAKATEVFNDETISHEQKAEIIKTIMKLYVKTDE